VRCRSQAIGIASLTGRIGNMIAPFTDYVVGVFVYLTVFEVLIFISCNIIILKSTFTMRHPAHYTVFVSFHKRVPCQYNRPNNNNNRIKNQNEM